MRWYCATRCEPASLVWFLLDDNYDYEFERRPINLVFSRSLNRALQGDFQGQCRVACAGQSQGDDVRGRRGGSDGGGERAVRGGGLSIEKEAALFRSPSSRSKTRDTTVARYISKVKDLLFSLLSLSRSTFAIIPLSIDLSLPWARCTRSRYVQQYISVHVRLCACVCTCVCTFTW